ncbi:hypothetical protein StoSoilB13_19530 [Arthrobacter sp. StoSoilB13]|nr:hypothetical protein StoSoilB13_19530 [Arthrobacter sp. StoSoilB13]
MASNRYVCTECLKPDLTAEECIWSNPNTKTVGHAPPRRKPFQSYSAEQLEHSLWRNNGWKLHCPEGHLLPPDSHERDMLVIALWGESGAGKTAFVKALINQLELENTLKPLGITGELAPGWRQTYKNEYLNKNEPTHPILSGQPLRKPLVLEVEVNGRMLNVLLYDTSGEEGKTEEEAQNQYHFAHITDVLLFFAPPATLDKLPAEARRRGRRATQSKLLTREKIQVAVDVAKGSPRQMRRRQKLVVPIFVLSKADQLSEATGFPVDVLKPRKYDRGVRGVISDLNAEADELVPYIIDKGGETLLHKVQSFNGKGRCVAVSGTGSDDDDSGTASASVAGAPNRCLDPLIIALWELGFIEAKP